MTQAKLLSSMFSKLSDSLESDRPVFYKNYEQQLKLYEQLFEAPFTSAAERERSLISARCIIALSRSLTGEVCKQSLDAVKSEIEILKPFFNGNKIDGEKDRIKAAVQRRIAALSPICSDEMLDAVLFLYLSLEDAQA